MQDKKRQWAQMELTPQVLLTVAKMRNAYSYPRLFMCTFPCNAPLQLAAAHVRCLLARLRSVLMLLLSFAPRGCLHTHSHSSHLS